MNKLPYKMEVGCQRHLGACAIGSQFLDGQTGLTAGKYNPTNPTMSLERRKKNILHTDATVEREGG